MGNTKYPLNGKYMVLEDLVTEYAFNTVSLSNSSTTNADIVIKLIDTDGTSGEIYKKFFNDNRYVTVNDLNNVKMYDIPILPENSNIDINTLKDWYNLFELHIRHGDERSKYPYELCYFPTVYSKTERSLDNKRYKIILEGDDAEFSPDRYIKFKDTLESYDNRVIVPFHYVYSDEFGNDNTGMHDLRFSFNYKLDTGESSITYAIRLLYALNTEINSAIGENSNGLYISSSTNSSADTLVAFKPKSTFNIVDILLFGGNSDKEYYNASISSNNTNDSVNEINTPYYIGFTQNFKDAQIAANLMYIACLLHDIALYKDLIIKYENDKPVISNYAYKILNNAYYRDTENKYKFNYNDFNITCKLNNNIINTDTQISWQLFLELLFNIKHFDTSGIITNTSSYLDISTKSYYNVYDNSEYNDTETNEYKRYNLYWKVMYYSAIISGCLLYYTGIVFDALYYRINDLHIYTMESPIYRCDIGADKNIIDVIWNSDKDIIYNYGLPARTLSEDDDYISVDIPAIVKTDINSNDVIIHKVWTIREIKKMLKSGLNKRTNNSFDINTDINTNINTSEQIEYMKLIQEKTDDTSVYTLATYEDINDVVTKNLEYVVFSNDQIKNIVNPIVDKKELVLPDSSLNVYNPVTNKSLNSMLYIKHLKPMFEDTSINKYFVGTLLAHISYNRKYLECKIPIMRLQNYYYIEHISSGRTIFIFYKPPTNVNFTDINNYVSVKYTFKENSNILSSINNTVDSSYYLMSSDSNDSRLHFISGNSHVLGNSNISFYISDLYVNDNKMLPETGKNWYAILNPNLLDTIIFNKGQIDSGNENTFIISHNKVTGNTFNVYNQCKSIISLLYKEGSIDADVATNTPNDNNMLISWSGDISIGECTNNFIYDATQAYHKLYVFTKGDKIMHLANDKSEFYILRFNNPDIVEVIVNDIEFTSIKNNNTICIYNTPIYRYTINTISINGKVINNILFSDDMWAKHLKYSNNISNSQEKHNYVLITTDNTISTTKTVAGKDIQKYIDSSDLLKKCQNLEPNKTITILELNIVNNSANSAFANNYSINVVIQVEDIMTNPPNTEDPETPTVDPETPPESGDDNPTP